MRRHRIHVPGGTSLSLRRACRLQENHALRKASGTCHPDPGTRYPQRRRGAALIFVLILLLFLSMLGISLARLSIAQHRQRLNEEIRVQTVRLAEAGWNRAARKLAQNPDYAGEVWQLDADALGPDRTANIRIEILPADNDPATKRLLVTAEYPVDNPHVNRVSREGVVQ